MTTLGGGLRPCLRVKNILFCSSVRRAEHSALYRPSLTTHDQDWSEGFEPRSGHEDLANPQNRATALSRKRTDLASIADGSRSRRRQCRRKDLIATPLPRGLFHWRLLM